mgnify:CR=1 FL=1|tara:strand:+ start:538 stop:717 length:180 start_codon:yes stop_codon:yes gene_type:complete
MIKETHERLLKKVLESNKACAELLKEKNVTQAQLIAIPKVLISNNEIIQTLLNIEELNK